MAAKPFDPLTFIPTPNTIRERLADTRELANRLEILLSVAEQIHSKNEPTAAPNDGGSANRAN